jgi:hypothetical protein
MFIDHRLDPYARDAVASAPSRTRRRFWSTPAALAGVSAADAHGYAAASVQEALLHGLAMAHRRLPTASVYVSEQANSRGRAGCWG